MFGIKLIILRSELNVATFWICMDATFFFVFDHFLLQDTKDRKISRDQKRLFFAVSLCPLHSSRTLPLTQLKILKGLQTKLKVECPIHECLAYKIRWGSENTLSWRAQTAITTTELRHPLEPWNQGYLMFRHRCEIGHNPLKFEITSTVSVY